MPAVPTFVLRRGRDSTRNGYPKNATLCQKFLAWRHAKMGLYFNRSRPTRPGDACEPDDWDLIFAGFTLS
jgi:hypothetical protein